MTSDENMQGLQVLRAVVHKRQFESLLRDDSSPFFGDVEIGDETKLTPLSIYRSAQHNFSSVRAKLSPTRDYRRLKDVLAEVQLYCMLMEMLLKKETFLKMKCEFRNAIYNCQTVGLNFDVAEADITFSTEGLMKISSWERLKPPAPASSDCQSNPQVIELSVVFPQWPTTNRTPILSLPVIPAWICDAVSNGQQALCLSELMLPAITEFGEKRAPDAVALERTTFSRIFLGGITEIENKLLQVDSSSVTKLTPNLYVLEAQTLAVVEAYWQNEYRFAVAETKTALFATIQIEKLRKTLFSILWASLQACRSVGSDAMRINVLYIALLDLCTMSKGCEWDDVVTDWYKRSSINSDTLCLFFYAMWCYSAAFNSLKQSTPDITSAALYFSRATEKASSWDTPCKQKPPYEAFRIQIGGSWIVRPIRRAIFPKLPKKLALSLKPLNLKAKIMMDGRFIQIHVNDIENSAFWIADFDKARQLLATHDRCEVRCRARFIMGRGIIRGAFCDQRCDCGNPLPLDDIDALPPTEASSPTEREESSDDQD